MTPAARTHVWIAYQACGCVVGVADDIPINGADIGKWIKQGRRLERVTDEEYRNMDALTICTRCPHGQPSLFADEGSR